MTHLCDVVREKMQEAEKDNNWMKDEDLRLKEAREKKKPNEEWDKVHAKIQKCDKKKKELQQEMENKRNNEPPSQKKIEKIMRELNQLWEEKHQHTTQNEHGNQNQIQAGAQKCKDLFSLCLSTSNKPHAKLHAYLIDPLNPPAR